MEFLFTKFYELVKGPTSAHILMVGLDFAGKTAIIQYLRYGEVVPTIPTMCYNVESIEFKGITLTIWELGGKPPMRKFWDQRYDNIDAIIFVIDSVDNERLEEAKEEMWSLLREKKLVKCHLLIYANKQDLPGALSEEEMISELGIDKIKGRKWRVQPAIATHGNGLIEGLDWLTTQLRA